MFDVTPDGSVLDPEGRIVFFSFQRFISDIAEGDCCFICGARRDAVPFNDEHVMPDWILRRFGLHARQIEIPNQALLHYGRMTVPCCVTCNSKMGDLFEKPMKELFDGGYAAVSQEMKDYGPWRLFCWMALIFLKTHLKDKYLNYHLDRRKGDMKIAELHSWEELHHLHCVARAFHSRAQMDPEVLGSLMVVPAKVRPHFEGFDFIDLSVAQTMLLCVSDVAIVVVFNDSQTAISVAMENLQKKLGGPLSPLQLREIAVTLACLNLKVEPRPRFFSDIDIFSEQYNIKVDRPDQVQISDWDHELYGRMLHFITEDMVKGMKDGKQVMELVKTGRYTFLTTPEGTFDSESMEQGPASGSDLDNH